MERNYVDQLQYANSQVERVVAALLSRPPSSRPVVIVQADEGPFAGEPTGWGRPTPTRLERKFLILNAYYLPGPPSTELTDAITPVNSFRLVFDRYFGTGLGLLPDRNFVFRDLAHIFQFTDVTEQVRALIR